MAVWEHHVHTWGKQADTTKKQKRERGMQTVVVPPVVPGGARMETDKNINREEGKKWEGGEICRIQDGGDADTACRRVFAIATLHTEGYVKVTAGLTGRTQQNKGTGRKGQR